MVDVQVEGWSEVSWRALVPGLMFSWRSGRGKGGLVFFGAWIGGGGLSFVAGWWRLEWFGGVLEGWGLYWCEGRWLGMCAGIGMWVFVEGVLICGVDRWVLNMSVGFG